MNVTRTGRRPAAREAPWFERALLAVGVDPTIVEAVLGDLAEEYATRAAQDGFGAARWWCAHEALRSLPHLALNAAHRLDTRRRRVLFAGLTGTVTAVMCAALLWRSARLGPPARLVVGVRDTMVVNHVRPMTLPIRVLDSVGRPLTDTGVRYAWVSGASVTISPLGAVECLRRGDAVVRASLGELTADVALLCRPVRDVHVTTSTDFILGDPARELSTKIVGVDGAPVTLLTARVSVEDSTVATVSGLRIRPLRPGKTYLSVSVGDRGAGAAIRVFAPVRTLEGLLPAQRPGDRLVAADVHLAPGESVRWPLPAGLFYMQFLANQTATHGAVARAPTLAVDGPIMCLPKLGPGVEIARCLARAPGATVTVTHPGASANAVRGALALEWERAKDW